MNPTQSERSCSTATPIFDVRKATLEDVKPIMELVNLAYSENNRGYYRKNDGKGEGSRTTIDGVTNRIKDVENFEFYVCVNQKTEIVGNIYLNLLKGEKTDAGEMGMFAVHPNYQKKYKLGTLLLNYVEKQAKAKGLKQLFLEVVGPIGENNQQPLIAFYEKHKFSFTGKAEEFYYPIFKCPITLLEMKKNLD